MADGTDADFTLETDPDPLLTAEPVDDAATTARVEEQDTTAGSDAPTGEPAGAVDAEGALHVVMAEAPP